MKTTQKSIRILDELVESNGATIPEIAESLGIPTSTVHAHLKTLDQEGLVRNTGGVFDIGFEVLRFSGYLLNSDPAHRLIKPKLRGLSEKTGERAQFIAEHNGRGIICYVETSSEDAVQTDARMGVINPLHVTAAGKAILSRLPEDRVKAIISQHGLEQLTKETISDRDQLFEELEQIRESGYAINDEERIEKQRAVGVPVMRSSGTVVGGISVSGPAYRMQGDRFEEEIPNLLLGTSNEIELNLEYDQ